MGQYIVYMLLAFVAFSYAVLLAKHLLLNYELYKKVGAFALGLVVLFGAGYATSEYFAEQNRIDKARLAAIYSIQNQPVEPESAPDPKPKPKPKPTPKPKPKPTPKPKPKPKPKPVSNTANVLSFSRDAMIEINRDEIDSDDLRCLGILSKTEEILAARGMANENSQRDFDRRELELYSRYDYVIPTAWIKQEADKFMPPGTEKVPPDFADTVMACLED